MKWIVFISIFLSINIQADEVELLVKEVVNPSLKKGAADPNTELAKVYGTCAVIKAKSTGLNSTCKEKTPPQLRNLFYSFWQSTDKSATTKKKLAKLMGMIIKESSANPAAVADMKGVGSKDSYKSFFKVNKSYGIMSRNHFATTALLDKLLALETVTFDKQTNFGLAQQSADRLSIPKWGGTYLAGRKEMIKKMDSKSFTDWCLTKAIYSDSQSNLEKYSREKIKSCSMGYKTKAGIKCFGRTVNFCPRMNIELALRQPARYFETKAAAPLCANLFK